MTVLIVDLRFEVDTPDGEHASGTVRSDGTHMVVQSPNLAVLASGRSGSDLQSIARAVAKQGLVVTVADQNGPVMSLGAVRRRFWHRFVTRSKFVKVVSWRAAAKLKAIAVAGRGEGLSLPPPTPVPLHLPRAPWSRRRVTTTHDPYGGGHPRLYLSDTRSPANARKVLVFPLAPGINVIGNGEGVHLDLDGIDSLQAVVERTADDEYVLMGRGTTVHTYVNGQELPRQRLRTGSRIEMGPWRLTYVRDESSDHGRPYGGRIGGELGRQRPQEQVTYYQR